MAIIRNAAVALSFCFACACATPPKRLSRDEYLAEVTRTYDLPKEQVIAAADKVLSLVDPEDMVISHNVSGISAHRRFFWYFVLSAASGSDIWIFNAKEQDGKTLAQVQVTRSVGSVLPLPTSGGDFSVGGGYDIPGGIPWTAPELYQLFWSRIDFMLGRSTAWLTCDAWEVDMKKTMHGGLEPLCDGLTVEDLTPEGNPKPPNSTNSVGGAGRP